VEKNQLYYGDNLAVLREYIRDGSLILVRKSRSEVCRLCGTAQGEFLATSANAHTR